MICLISIPQITSLFLEYISKVLSHRMSCNIVFRKEIERLRAGMLPPYHLLLSVVQNLFQDAETARTYHAPLVPS
jgi:hypothetical protein